MLVNGDIYSAGLPEGYTVAASIYPSIFGDNSFINGTVVYNADAAKEIFSQEIVNFENGKFPSDVVLYYYDDGYVKNAVTNIVGHWQNNLSAFINIEAVSDSELLLSELTEPTYSFAIFPVSAESSEVAEYLKKFGVSYNGEELYDLQEKILKNINTIPLFFQNTNIAYSDSLDNVIFDYGNGYIDFSFLIKYE